jgi:hypothetical protein
VAVTGRRSAIRYEISDSCRISFSVSFAKPFLTLDAAMLLPLGAALFAAD